MASFSLLNASKKTLLSFEEYSTGAMRLKGGCDCTNSLKVFQQPRTRKEKAKWS
jgi:hypothetical protein